jgi:hypothetical protein
MTTPTILFIINLFQGTSRVAKWHIFKPQNPNWVNFEGSCNGRCFMTVWSILLPFGIFCGNLVNFMVFCTKKNLATLVTRTENNCDLFIGGYFFPALC